MPQSLTDAQILEMRALRASGVKVVEIAERFGVSRTHASRVINDRARVVLPDAGLELEDGAAYEAVSALLDGLDLEAADLVHKEVALSLARKLDQCVASDSAASASATPAIAKELRVTVDALRWLKPEPSPLDLIRARRDARLSLAGIPVDGPANGHGRGW